jgi:DNA-binding response OmpR family regulator
VNVLGRLLFVEASPGRARHLIAGPGLERFEVTVVSCEAAMETVARGGAELAAVVLAGTTEEGWPLARALRAVPRLSDVPLIAIGAATRADTAVAATRAGCARFLEEPCTAAELSVALETLLEPVSRPTRRPSAPDDIE